MNETVAQIQEESQLHEQEKEYQNDKIANLEIEIETL